ncbi:MAG: VWA domain-containing protein [Phycisphaerales bacterium]
MSLALNLGFDQPAWLWLAAAALPIAWLGARWFASMSTVRRGSAVALRVLLVALIAGMLAGASAVRRTDRIAVIGVVDVSGSVRRFASAPGGADARTADPIEAARHFFAASIKARGPDDLLGLVVFDGRSVAVATPTRGDPTDRPLDAAMTEGTDIEGALRFAAALIPPDAAGRIVLISDGNETSGDAEGAAKELAGRASGRAAAPVDVIPLAYSVERETVVEAVDAPPRAASESSITVRVTIFSTQGTRGTLFLSREGEPLDINGAAPGAGRRLELGPGRHVELITVELDASKRHRFRAVFEPDREETAESGEAGQPGPRESVAVAVGDTRPENNAGEAFTLTPGRGSVLILDGVGNGSPTGAGATLAAVLRESGLDVELLPPEAAPSHLLELLQHDLVVLQNVPVESVPLEFQELLSKYVREFGGGLVMVGGPDSFGAGGWHGSKVEPLLPVALDLPERLVQPDAAVIFVLDVSGSMRRPVMGTTLSQQEVANEAAALAVKSLDKKDLVGVIVFSDVESVLVPLGPNSDPDRTAQRILSLSPGGGTNMGPGLREAALQLRDAKAAVKHVILVSDGRSLGHETLPDLAAEVHESDGVIISTISIGDESDEQTMDQMASRGGGTFYPVYNPTLLPKFFLKAVRIVRSPLVREAAFQPVLLPTPSPLTAGLDGPPPLLGFNLTRRRPELTITHAMEAPTGEPLLAHWTVELGRVAAFTSDAHRWAEPWLDWPGYRRMWTQIARIIARPPGTGGLELGTEVRGDTITLRLDAAGESGRPLDLLTVPATVYAPSGAETNITLTQTAPGLYVGETPARESGSYIVAVKPRLGAQLLPPVVGGVSVSSGVEYRRLSSNVGLLRRVAEATGGRVLALDDPAGAKLFDRSGLEPSEARTPLWRTLLVWTLLVLMLDVATRRIAWDRLVSREFGADVRRAVADSVRDRGDQAARTVSRLRGGTKTGRPAVASVVLSDADARRVAEEATERRTTARRDAMRARRAPGGAALSSNEPPAVAGDAGSPGPAAPESVVPEDGLLAAKRRARERFRSDDDPPPGA